MILEVDLTLGLDFKNRIKRQDISIEADGIVGTNPSPQNKEKLRFITIIIHPKVTFKRAIMPQSQEFYFITYCL